MHTGSSIRPFLTGLIYAILMTLPSTLSARTPERMDFAIGNARYYLHRINYNPIQDADPEAGLWNQNMVADRDYIYIADHSGNASGNLVIKRYHALDCTPAEDLVINKDDIDYFGINELTDDERCFYLAGCDVDTGHLMLFPYVSRDGIPASAFSYSSYLIDKEGNIEREFRMKNVQVNYRTGYRIHDFGIPAIKGDPSAGNFGVLFPMSNYNGHLTLSLITFANGKFSTIQGILTADDRGYFKPSVRFVGDSHFIIDDQTMAPSLYSYKSDLGDCLGTLDCNMNAHGCAPFDFDGHRLLWSADLATVDGNNPAGLITQFNIGLWDDERITPQSRAASLDFSNYRPLASLQFDKSSIDVNKGLPYSYRQFMAVSDYGHDLKHLHFYVPGEFLATYQLSKNDVITGSDNVVHLVHDDANISIVNKTVVFSHAVADVSVYNMTGHMIFNSSGPVKSINLANFVNGTYFIKTPCKTYKINL